MLNSKYFIHHPQWKHPAEEDNRVVSAKKFPIEKLYGKPLKQLGKVLMGCCPFHEEKTPSFAIYPENNTWYCFACSAGGYALSFYMKKTGNSFIQAIEELNR